MITLKTLSKKALFISIIFISVFSFAHANISDNNLKIIDSIDSKITLENKGNTSPFFALYQYFSPRSFSLFSSNVKLLVSIQKLPTFVSIQTMPIAGYTAYALGGYKASAKTSK